MFKLLRYFSLTSLLTFVIISVLLGVFYRRITLGNLIALGENKNVALTEELLDYLYRQGKYAALGNSLLPGLILLDLNMPKKDGREALQAIKADPVLRRIPVVVLTTSKAEEDIICTYDLGVSSFIVKPVSFEALVEVMKTLARYWFDIVAPPAKRVGA
jgi:CheY-like chemotaxis protein